MPGQHHDFVPEGGFQYGNAALRGIPDMDVLADLIAGPADGDPALCQRLAEIAIDAVSSVRASSVQRPIPEDCVVETKLPLVFLDPQLAGLFTCAIEAASH